MARRSARGVRLAGTRGVLAANPHNSQPWRFACDNIIDVFATGRNIGAIDPYRRELHLSVGCALENLVLAAEPYGYAADVALLPDQANPAHVARVTLAAATARESPLFDAIPLRHTDRGPYDIARKVAPEALSRLAGLGSDLSQVMVLWFTTEPDRQRVGELIVAATEAIVTDDQQSASLGGMAVVRVGRRSSSCATGPLWTRRACLRSSTSWPSFRRPESGAE
jgi:hypothetical protein